MEENQITGLIIGAAIEVHRALGPGLVECVYEEALCHELHLRGVSFARQVHVPIHYKGICLATPLRLDLRIAGKVVVEVKAVEQVAPIVKAQLLTYLRLSDLRVGLIVNFNVPVLREGISRVANGINDSEPPDLSASSAPPR